ncbi:putative autophagy protein Apg5 [Aureobasidium pullulans]|nr:putative autophagy protein Apg5 [Aureobasidium pullulans]
MATPLLAIAKIQKKVWDGSLPLEIRLANADCRTYDEADPYLINLPRLSYLPFLLPRLHAFFAPSLINPSTPPHELWLSFQGVPLKYHHPVGLLYDLFSGAPPANPDDDEVDAEETLPWKLELRVQEFPPELMGLDAEGKVVRDCFVNGVKEADVIRNGKGNVYMGLSKNDSDVLWEAVKTHNLQRFNTINNKLLNPPGTPLRNIPMKIYLPTAPSIINPEEGGDSTIQASIRTVQSLVAPFSGTRMFALVYCTRLLLGNMN